MKRIFPLALLMISVCVVVLPQEQKPRPELTSLVEAERSFSRTSVAKGLRPAFIEFFADDGIRFLPHPVNAQANFRERPAPPGPQTFTLSWDPVFADVSQAGDLGFTTGPYWVTDNAKKQPPSYGYYFSIWRKQSDGSWKVLLDYGTDAPTPPDTASAPPLKSAANTGWRGNAMTALDDATVLANLDRETSALAARAGVRETYQKYLLRDARLHRAGLMPLVEENSILTFLDQQQWTDVSFEPIAAGVARSADLGYTYGRYSLRHKDAPAVLEKGYYARVWKRDGKGNWKIAMDVANALPAEAPAKP
jgi:ketosteroid isomerase-like protein